METSTNIARPEKKVVKCVVWDLDNTLWQGVLAEDGEVRLRSHAADAVRALDERGILQSVASKNDHAPVLQKLESLGLAEYFLYPEIHWGTKAESVARIAKNLNIGLDAVAFVDDQPFERDEVRFAHPSVLCIDAADVERMLEMPELIPRFITLDSKQRRRMYLEDIARSHAEERFEGPKEEFLATLGMRLEVGPALEEDLQRAEELTIRTNQLNSTGRPYSYSELDALRASPTHALWVASLEDRYGSYGKIGLILLELQGSAWVLKLFLMSCRVMTRGIGTALLHLIMARAASAGVKLLAEFVPTDRNRMMYVTYKFAGFKEAGKEGDVRVLECSLDRIMPWPAYIALIASM